MGYIPKNLGMPTFILKRYSNRNIGVSGVLFAFFSLIHYFCVVICIHFSTD